MVLKEKRVFYYDFLRAFAIIAVILCHVDGLYEFTTANLKVAIPILLNNIGLIGVPIFFMLSGSLLLNRNYSLKEFFTKRFFRIAYPFIFWILVTILIGIFYFKWDTSYVLTIFFGTPAPSWYIWTLMGIYLFFPIINSFLKEYGLKGIEYFLIIWFLTIILNTFHLYPFKCLELSYFAGYVGYCVLGYYLDNKKFRFDDKTTCLIGIITLLISTTIHMIFTYYHIDLLSPMYLNLIIVFQAIGMFISVKYFFTFCNSTNCKVNSIYNNFKENALGKFIISLSVCSYGMYFIHYILIKFLKEMNIHSIKLLPLILLGVVVLSWFITYVLSKIPIIDKISGVK